jgi:UPF0042 nucleotide-binding protein
VSASVLAAPPNGWALADSLFKIAIALAGPRPVTVAVGCVGGRHRSVALANELVYTLRIFGYRATVRHRDIERPVLPSRSHR